MKTLLSFCTLCLLFISSLTVSGQQTQFTNPVIRADMADPTVVRIGDVYYASGTSSEWAPFYPMYKSSDLVNWTQIGHLFDKQPEWTLSSFWAPELFYHNNKLFAYYTARNKEGVSYIGVATADKPEGSFTDHGPVVSLGTEAIDAFILEDKGKLYISWKAYGLDKRPIELLACQLSADGLKLVGEPFSLLKDDERIGMEGQHWFKSKGYYYLIYSINGCCGPRSDYAVSVARSKKLTGPYEKYTGNPILHGDGKDVLSCGHGTITTTPDGRMYYLFHAYLTGANFYGGRQVMLQELTIGKDGWPAFTTGDNALLTQPMPFKNTVQQPVTGFDDTFDSPNLSLRWAWNYPYASSNIQLANGQLSLSGTAKPGNPGGTALCVRPFAPTYSYETQVMNTNASLKGLTMYGDDKEWIAFGCEGNALVLKLSKKGETLLLTNLPLPTAHPYLRVEVRNGVDCTFAWSADKVNWISVNTLDATPLVRWDRVARPGLFHAGAADAPAVFSYFSIR